MVTTVDRYQSLLEKRRKLEDEKVSKQAVLGANKQRLEEAYKELKDKFGVSSLEEAESLLATKQTELEVSVSALESALSKYESLKEDSFEVDGV